MFIIYKHMIINNDSFEYLKKIENNSIDLILTDPPNHLKEINNKNTLGIKKTKLSNYKNITQTEWDKMKENINEYFL